MTKMYRKTTCNGCGFTQETNTSYYLDRKQWRASHTLTVHNAQKAFKEFYEDLLAL